MKVVIDTNVMVSGLLAPFGPAGEVVRMVSGGRLSLCYNARILAENAEGLTRPKFPFTGNLGHYPRGRRQGVTVVNPTKFLDLYRKTRQE